MQKSSLITIKHDLYVLYKPVSDVWSIKAEIQCRHIHLKKKAQRRRKPGMRLTDKGGSMPRLRDCPAERLGKQDANF